jgi:hypothetical protein
MPKSFLGTFLSLLFVLAAAAAAYWEFVEKPKHAAPPAMESAATGPVPKSADTAAEPKYPVTAPADAIDEAETPEAPAKTAATPAKSPGTIADALRALLGEKMFDHYVMPEALIHRIVVTVANENTPRFPGLYLPWKPFPEAFQVDKGADGDLLSPRNYQRYDAAISLLESLRAEDISKVYARFYPSFQRTYAELGEKGYFNDRLVAALDDILNANPTGGPLTQETLSYHFANPDVENLPAGQKLLLRMGPRNAQRLKKKLAEIRALVTKTGKSVD